MIAPQPFFRARGTPFSVLHRIRALTLGGHSVHLLTYPFGEDIALPGLTITRSSGVPLVRDIRIGPSLAKLGLDWPLYRLTARYLDTGRYDVVHSHEEAAFFCVGLARKHGLPHLYDMHSSLPQQLGNFDKFDYAPVRRLFERLENYVLETCDGVITICDDLARVVEASCPDTPHRMIENTADDRQVFVARGANVREKWNLQGKAIVLYTGTFEAYQGLDLLRDAFAIVSAAQPDAHLLMVGGTPEQVKAFGQAAADQGLGDRVTLTGTVHPSEIPDFIDAADLIVSPRSSGTNTPLKIYGYMRSGRPIVATDRLTHTQILDARMAELVEPTADGLAAGISRVLSQPAHGQALAAEASAFAEREFSDEAYVQKVLGLYDDMYDRLERQGSGYTAIAD